MAGEDMDMREEVEYTGAVALEADEMDAAFQGGDHVEVEFDGNEDEPPDGDSDGEGQMEEMGVVGENEVYGETPDADDSAARVTHAESVLSVAFCPSDRRILLTGGQDDAAVLWGIEEQPGGGIAVKERRRLEGHTDSVSQVAFSHDGKFAATGSYDGTVRIWNPETGDLVHALDGPSKEIEWILWHPKGHAILAGSADTMAWMWWAPTGKLMQIFAGHGQTVTCGAWGLGGKLIVTGSEDRSVIVWNPRGGTPQQNIREAHQSTIVSMCAHPEAPLVVTGSEDSTARVIHIETGKVVATLPDHEQSVEACAFNDPGTSGISLLVTASMDGIIQVWDGKTFDKRCMMKDHVEQGGVVRFKWLQPPHFGSWLCTCATDGTVRVFDALAGRCTHTLRGHVDTVLDVDAVVGEGGQMAIASGSEDSSCRIFTLSLGGVGAPAAVVGGAASA